MGTDPITTARKVLASIQRNINRLLYQIRHCNPTEHKQLASELRIARNQEKEAKKYV